MNRDGKLDLVASGEGEMNLGIFLGNGDGTFGAMQKLPIGGMSGAGITITDLNGDSVPDIAAVRPFTAPVRVFLGRGDGTFGPEKGFSTAGNSVFGIAAGDFNNDGRMDLVASDGGDNSVSVLLNTTVSR